VRRTEIATVSFSGDTSDAHVVERTMKKRVNIEGRITTLAWLARVLSLIQLETKRTGIIGKETDPRRMRSLDGINHESAERGTTIAAGSQRLPP